MHYLILLLFGSFLAMGIYFILAYFFKVPTLKSTKAIMNIGKVKKKQARDSDAFILDLAVKLAKYIHLEPTKVRQMKSVLQSAEIKMTPEVYLAQGYIKTGMVAVFIPICLLIVPIISPVFLIIAIGVFFSETKKAEKIVEGRRKEIEYELPRFVATLTQSLMASRDVQTILDTYCKSAGPALKNELMITTADMATGNYKEALLRFESRVPTSQISQIVQGLRGVLDGSNNAGYFERLSITMKEIELSRLKKLAYERPPKIRKYSFLLLACMLMMFMGVMGYQILGTMSGMF